MDGRKLQMAGGSTYVISLPKRWVNNAGLKSGDTLFVEAQPDGSISVRHRGAERPAVRRKVFDQEPPEGRDRLLRKLLGAYVSGFGIIEIRFPPERGPLVRKVAREFCTRVLGPEIVEESRQSLTLQDVSDPTEISSEKCLRRMHLIVRTMLEDALTSVVLNRSSLAADVAPREVDVDRLYWRVLKHYHIFHTAPSLAPGGARTPAIYAHRLVAKTLERIGDHAERVARLHPAATQGRELDPRTARALEEAGRGAMAVLDQAFTSFMTVDAELADAALEAAAAQRKVCAEAETVLEVRKGSQLLALGRVLDSLERVAGYAADIAEQAIDLAVLDGGTPAPAAAPRPK